MLAEAPTSDAIADAAVQWYCRAEDELASAYGGDFAVDGKYRGRADPARRVRAPLVAAQPGIASASPAAVFYRRGAAWVLEYLHFVTQRL